MKFWRQVAFILLFIVKLLAAADLNSNLSSLSLLPNYLEENTIHLKTHPDNFIELFFDKTKLPTPEQRLLTTQAFMDPCGTIYLYIKSAFGNKYFLPIKNGKMLPIIAHQFCKIGLVFHTTSDTLYFVGQTYKTDKSTNSVGSTSKQTSPQQTQILIVKDGKEYASFIINSIYINTAYILDNTVFLHGYDFTYPMPVTSTKVVTIKNDTLQSQQDYGLRAITHIKKSDDPLILNGIDQQDKDTRVTLTPPPGENSRCINPLSYSSGGTSKTPLPNKIRIHCPDGLNPAAILANASILVQKVSYQKGMKFYNFFQTNTYKILNNHNNWLELYISLCDNLKQKTRNLYYYARTALVNSAICSGHIYFDTYASIPGFKVLNKPEEVVLLGTAGFQEKLNRTIELAMFFRDLWQTEPVLFNNHKLTCFTTIYALYQLDPNQIIWKLILKNLTITNS